MKKKIAVLATYVGKNNRGAETFVIELIKRLKDDYDIDVYSIGENTEILDCITVVNVESSKIYRLHEWFYNKYIFYRTICRKFYNLIPDIIFQYYFTKKVYEKYLINIKYDLVFVNNGIWGAKFANLLRLQHKTPFICVGHGGIGTGEKRMLKEKPDQYIALSDEQEKWAMHIYDKVTKIYNGVDCERFCIDAKDKKEDSKEKIILDVGALTKFKRHELVIDAVSLLSNTRLIILGKGELQAVLQKYGKRKLGNRFVLTSSSYEDIKKFYSEATVFTLPSYNEPFGIVYLEALAAGLPVVAPRDNIRNKIIGNAGILCSCENPREYARALQCAMDKKWGQIPHKQAMKFDWSIISKRYRDVFEYVMKTNTDTSK